MTAAIGTGGVDGGGGGGALQHVAVSATLPWDGTLLQSEVHFDLFCTTTQQPLRAFFPGGLPMAAGTLLDLAAGCIAPRVHVLTTVRAEMDACIYMSCSFNCTPFNRMDVRRAALYCSTY